MTDFCTYHDSETTSRGTTRKQIYIGCSNGKSYEAKAAALKDFNAQKEPINKVLKIKPFNRTTLTSSTEREKFFERQEHSDAAAAYLKFIL